MPSAQKMRGIRRRLWHYQDGRCFYCDAPTVLDYPKKPPRNGATIDHIIPKSEGGGLIMQNLVMACKTCNTTRGHRSAEEFLVIKRG